MRSVFDGGDGCTSGGREERSIESGEPWPKCLAGLFALGEEVGDAGGDIGIDDMVVIAMRRVEMVMIVI